MHEQKNSKLSNFSAHVYEVGVVPSDEWSV